MNKPRFTFPTEENEPVIKLKKVPLRISIGEDTYNAMCKYCFDEKLHVSTKPITNFLTALIRRELGLPYSEAVLRDTPRSLRLNGDAQ